LSRTPFLWRTLLVMQRWQSSHGLLQNAIVIVIYKNSSSSKVLTGRRTWSLCAGRSLQAHWEDRGRLLGQVQTQPGGCPTHPAPSGPGFIP
jgi:hypothetical protein